MKCPICGKDMVLGSVERKGLGGYDNKYVFEAEDKEKDNHKIRNMLKKKKIDVNIFNESTAWYCSDCKKILMMADSEE